MHQNFLSKTERDALAPRVRAACEGQGRPDGEARWLVKVNARSLVAVKRGHQTAGLVLSVREVFFVGDRLTLVDGAPGEKRSGPWVLRDTVVTSVEVACLMEDTVCTSAPCGSLLAIMGSRTIWFHGERADHWARQLGFKSYADCKACVALQTALPCDAFIVRWDAEEET